MKSVTRSALLRSSILLSSLSAISAQDVCPGLVAFESPYLAVYPVSISTYIAANTVFNINGNGYITINNAPTNLETVISATSTVTSTVTSTATTTTTATANTAVATGVVTTIAQPILLDGTPGTTSRLMRRQQSGTYLGGSGNTVQGSCTQAAAFFLTNGQLTFGGEFFSTTVGTSYALFEASSTTGSISSGFYSNNGVLGWNNTNFDNGIARFCSTGSSFYAVFTGSYPSGCTPFIFNIELETACSGYGSTTITGSTTASGSSSVTGSTGSTSSTGTVTSPTSTASISVSGSSSSSSTTESTTGSTASTSSSSSSPSGTGSSSSGSSGSSTIAPSTTLTGSLTLTSSASFTNSSAAASTTNTANPTIPTDLPAGATPVVVSFAVPGLSKRQSGGTRYLKSDGTFTADKSQAAVLGLLDGSLYAGPDPYSTNEGTDNEVFAVYDDIGTITTLFELTNGLTWNNGNFSINTAGNAEFAIVSSTVYAAFNSLPAGATVVSPSASTLPTTISGSSSSAAASTVSASITSAGSSLSSSTSGSTTPASTTPGNGATSSSAPATTGSSSSSSIITTSSMKLTSSSAPYGNFTSSLNSTSV